MLKICTAERNLKLKPYAYTMLGRGMNISQRNNTNYYSRRAS